MTGPGPRPINWHAGPYLTALANDDERTCLMRLQLVGAQRDLSQFSPDGRAAAATHPVPRLSLSSELRTTSAAGGTGVRQASTTARLIDRVIARLLR